MPTTEIHKNAGETLRVERGEYQGIDLLHVRVWTGRPGDPNAKPTQKGLSLRPEVWREVLPAVAALLEGGGDSGATD
jgi:hypothetical protein